MIVPSDAQFPKMADGRTNLATTFVSIRGSITLCSIFVYFVCFVVLNHPGHDIRVHSCPFVVLILFVYFVCFVVQSIRVH